MNKKSVLRRFLTNVYGFAFCDKLLFLTPVYTVFMQSRGISDFALSVLIILLSLGTLFSQFPVVWLTNHLGAKRTVILGQIIKAIGMTLWVVWPTFWGFAIGMILWGVQWGTFSIAFEALMYDELAARRHRAMYTKVLARRNVLQNVAIALSAIGSLLMVFGYNWVTVASAAMCAVSCVFVGRIIVRAPQNPVKNTDVRKLFRVALHAHKKDACVFIVMMLSLLVANLAYLEDYLGPIGLEIGLPVGFVGLISFFTLGCYAVGQIIAYRLPPVRDWMLYAAIVGAGTMYVMFSGDYSLSGLWALGVGYMMIGAINILLYARFQDMLPTKYRAVFLSLHNIGTNIVYIGTCLIIGLGGSMGSWRYSVAMLGALIMLVGMWATLFARDRCVLDR